LSEQSEAVRRRTDTLDAVGNTNKAMLKVILLAVTAWLLFIIPGLYRRNQNYSGLDD
jgi:Na+/H+-translocating membrane pyrophosphatase